MTFLYIPNSSFGCALGIIIISDKSRKRNFNSKGNFPIFLSIGTIIPPIPPLNTPTMLATLENSKLISGFLRNSTSSVSNLNSPFSKTPWQISKVPSLNFSLQARGSSSSFAQIWIRALTPLKDLINFSSSKRGIFIAGNAALKNSFATNFSSGDAFIKSSF